MTVKNIENIAIIGGGPGGLMLGLLLQQQGYNFTIFEKESPEINKNRGGSLDIHADTGQLPLKEAGIYEAFKSLVRYEGEDTRVIGKDGTVHYEEDAEGIGERPEIDRGELCDIIKEQIEPDHFKYGYTFQSLIQHGPQDVEINFSNGETERFDLIIGSDGAFSKVRDYLTDTEPSYTGISMIEINIPDVKHEHPELLKYNKNGKMMALGGNQALLAQLNGDGSIKVYVSYRMDYQTFNDYKAMSISELQKQLLADFSEWDQKLRYYIEAMNNEVLCRRIYKLPIGFKWQHHSAMTLMGDAAHLMSPFAGEGVNMALYDAYLFAESLKSHEDIDRAIKSYESKIYQVSKVTAQESQDNLELMFSEDAAEQLASFFKTT
ncbi:FAD-dependent oxidoreductase [Staphylococcus edaphicus]|uniref:FAD-dependent monooxygenase n=1 Tax=Staphylococcus edaphicus TaxID=1955013 RepID=A0A2C6WLN5_9STAP|nr:FAD-dependent monooxygenase [Staphylococcus edaphicus]PHK50010.1 tetracycline resistance protein [Staphylococcus edaphicus]UQW81730.1 FAD-dependent monooxygenase [Staphylococcus edaphicus]